MTAVYVHDYWAWVHKGSRAIDPNSLTNKRSELYSWHANQEGKIVRVSVRVLRTVQVIRHSSERAK
jgi:hypothetical protein